MSDYSEKSVSQKHHAEENEKKNGLRNAALSGANFDTVQRYGSGVKEHLVAYFGKDRETGQVYSKSLKGIAESEVNPHYRKQNIKQQAGFSAEVKATAKENAERAIRGDTHRTTRTDDMKTQPDGKGGFIGGRNEQYYDVAEIDGNGIYVEGTGRQLKFVGGNAGECADKLLDKKYDKYRERGVDIEVPSDFYDGVKKQLEEESAKLQKRVERAEKNGNRELAAKLREEQKRVEKTKQSLKKSNVSNKEALLAREHPRFSTAKDIAQLSHRAGLEAAKQGAVVGGSISIVQNAVALVKGDIDVDEAAVNIVTDTGKAVAISYGTGFAGSAIKGMMQNSSSIGMQSFSKTNLPAALVTTAFNTGKTMKKYFAGDIDGTQCLEEIGRDGTGMLASSMGAVIGQAAIPIPVVGAMLGSMVGYAMSSASYGILTEALQGAKWAHEERLRIEAECQAQIQLIRQYRQELERSIHQYLSQQEKLFADAFEQMKRALWIDDVDGFISGANSITECLGKKPQFATMDEFEKMMDDQDVVFTF